MEEIIREVVNLQKEYEIHGDISLDPTPQEVYEYINVLERYFYETVSEYENE